MVVTNPAGQVAGGSHLVVAISTRIPDPVPSHFVLLPYYHPRHPVTGLNKKAGANCTWVAEVEPGRIIRKLGTVPGPLRIRIALEMDRIAPPDA